MILSTKGRYGLKAAFELALNYGKGPVSLKKISDKYGISEHYLEQILAKLRKRGYIKTVRGAQGGYLLSKEPDDVTVGMILRALEGEMSPSECLNEDVCTRQYICVSRIIWEKIENSINNVIDNTTLGNMIDEHEKINQEGKI